MTDNGHKTGQELQAITDRKIHTFQQFLEYLEEQPVSEINSAMIQYFEDELRHMNGADGSLRWYLTGDEARSFLEWHNQQTKK